MDERDDLVQEPSLEDTSVDEDAPAPAEASEGQDTPRKWAGKYDDPTELEKAYLEAQKKLSELGEKSARLEALLTNPAPAYPGYPMSAAPGAPVPIVPPAAPPSAASPDLDIDVPIDEQEWYANPREAAKKVAAVAARKAAEQAAKAAREEAARVAQMTQMEQQFYATYPELKKYPRLVNAAAAEVAQKMAALDLYRRQILFPDPMKAVAEIVRADLAAIAEEARTKPQTTPPLHVAGGSGAVGAAQPRKPTPKLTPEEEAFQEREAMYFRTLK